MLGAAAEFLPRLGHDIWPQGDCLLPEECLAVRSGQVHGQSPEQPGFEASTQEEGTDQAGRQR